MQHSVLVGGDSIPVSDTEWFVATLPRDTPVRWKCKPRAAVGGPPEGVGLFRFSYFYDGVVARVEAGGKGFTLVPDLDRDMVLERLEDVRLLNEAGMGGDGI